MVQRGRPLLQVPGPTNIPDRILNAMHRPAVDFSSPYFIDFATAVFEDIKPVFGTEGTVFIFTSSGHGAWESSLVNLMPPGDTVLLPETGRFARVWKEMATTLGFNVEVQRNDWRSAIDPEAIEQRLKQDTKHQIKAVLAVHIETATGALSDLPAIRQAIDNANHPAFLIVDAIASLGTMPLPMDDWGVDVTIAASQKGLMLPPGLGFAAVSDRALKASQSGGSPREYWSWQARNVQPVYKRFCGTAPEHMIFGLRESIEMLNEEGLENVFARHHRLAEATRKAVGAWCQNSDFEFNVIQPDQRANSLTVVRTPDGFDSEILRTAIRDRFSVTLGAGLADLSGRVIRIGHMGDLNEPMILGALGSIEAGMQACGLQYGKGGVDAAIQYLANIQE